MQMDVSMKNVNARNTTRSDVRDVYIYTCVLCFNTAICINDSVSN